MTFTISQHLRRRYRREPFELFAMAVVVIAAARWGLAEHITNWTTFWGIAVICTVVLVVGSALNARRFLRWAEHHSVTLDREGIWMNEPHHRTVVPWAAVAKITPRPGWRAARRLVVKMRDGGWLDLRRYEDLPALRAAIEARIESDVGVGC